MAVVQVRGAGAAPSLLKLLEWVREEAGMGGWGDVTLSGAVGFYYYYLF